MEYLQLVYHHRTCYLSSRSITLPHINLSPHLPVVSAFFLYVALRKANLSLFFFIAVSFLFTVATHPFFPETFPSLMQYIYVDSANFHFFPLFPSCAPTANLEPTSHLVVFPLVESLHVEHLPARLSGLLKLVLLTSLRQEAVGNGREGKGQLSKAIYKSLLNNEQRKIQISYERILICDNSLLWHG